MSKRWQFKSVLTRQVFWFLVLALVPVGIAVTTLYFQRSAVIKQREFEKLQTIRDLKVRALNTWIDERASDLQIASDDNDIRRLEGAAGADRRDGDADTLRRTTAIRSRLRRFVEAYDSYRAVSVVSAETGQVVISTESDDEGQSKRRDSNIVEVVRTHKLHIEDIHHSRHERRAAMLFSAPVFCRAHKGEHLVAIVVAQIDLEQSLYPLLLEHTGLGTTGETLIVNRGVMALNELRWHKDAPLRLKISAEPAVRAANGETGIAETPDYRGAMVLAAYTFIPRTGWGFVAKRDLAEIYAPIRAMIRDMAIILVLSALMALLVATLLGRIIARPIVAIADTAGRIHKGDLAARCDVVGSDELAHLSASFNEMADTMVMQVQVQTASVDIVNTMVAASSVDEFASALVRTLLRATGANVGSFYLRRAPGTVFERVSSVGLGAEAPAVFDAELGEGEFGAALDTRTICYTENLSSDTMFAFKATIGTSLPQQLVTIPLVVEQEPAAVVSIATLGVFSPEHREIIERAWVGMNTVLSDLIASNRTQQLAKELRVQSDELQSRALELAAKGAELAEANRLKSEFLSSTSHELRTPLNSVLALSQLMLARGLGKDLAQETEYLQVIERNGRNLLSLISDILDLSKIEAGAQEVFPVDIAVQHLAAAAIATVRVLADDKSLTLALSAPDDLPTLVSDAGRVRQILLNLLSNAVKFSHVGSVTLRVAATAETMTFSVEDSGVGIEPDDLEHIFEEFRQVDGSGTRQYGGTGLGLAISRRLAGLLGGEISVASEPGVGSTFTLTLPICVDAPDDGVLVTPQRETQVSAAPREAR